MSTPALDAVPALWTSALCQLAVTADGRHCAYRPVTDPTSDDPWLVSDPPAPSPSPDADTAAYQLDLLAAVVDRLGGLALLRRSRTGSLVVEVTLLPWCPACVTGDDVAPADDAQLYAMPTGHGELAAVSVLCADHARLAGPQARQLPLGELAAAVGAPAGWAGPAAVARLQPVIARRRWSGQARGPLLAERTVTGLRMGHVGYVPPTAIRLDGQRRLVLVDLDAPAPQRPTGACVVPVRRTVHLGWEVFVGIDGADRNDLAWSQPGSPVTGRNEATVTDVRGLWGTPLLAATLNRPADAPVGLEGPVRHGRHPELER